MVGKRFINYLLMLLWCKVKVLTSLRLLFLASCQPPYLKKAPKNFTILKWWRVVTWFFKDDLPWVKYENYSRLLLRYRVIKSLKINVKDEQNNGAQRAHRYIQRVASFTIYHLKQQLISLSIYRYCIVSPWILRILKKKFQPLKTSFMWLMSIFSTFLFANMQNG